MIIYWDLVIGSTVLVNYAILKSIAIVFKEKLNYLRVVFALLISVFSLALLIIPGTIIYHLRYLVGILIGIIAFRRTTIENKIIKIVIFYLLNMAFVGTLVAFKVDNLIMFLVSLGYILVLWILENYKNLFIKQEQKIYQVRINQKEYRGYLDTGNSVYYRGVPVVFIKTKYFDTTFSYLNKCSVATVTSSSELDIYQGSPLMIGQSAFIVYYCFVDNINQDIILHREFEGEKNA